MLKKGPKYLKKYMLECQFFLGVRGGWCGGLRAGERPFSAIQDGELVRKRNAVFGLTGCFSGLLNFFSIKCIYLFICHTIKLPFEIMLNS